MSDEVKLTVTRAISDTDGPWHVGLSRPDMVFYNGDRNNETNYRRSLAIIAKTSTEAEQIVMMMILDGRVSTTSDRLWAWR